jgi:glucose-6-phosphate-specific signal transduction histidine kinase
MMNSQAMRAAARSVARSDLRWVFVGTVLTFAVSSVLELQEKLASAALRFEAWQIDELPLTLTALSLGLAWYAWRRRGEAARLLAHNRELAQQLIAVQENERRALARELHDDVAQHCTSIRIEAACIERSRDAAQIVAAAQRSAAAAGLLYESVRRLLRQLRPAELDELGLVAAVQALCDGSDRRGRTRCRFEADASMPLFGEAVDTAVYRVAQEALSNAMRHAGARCVAVRLSVRFGDGGGRPRGASDGELILRIDDDGQGFEPSTKIRGLGLLGAAERAAALGGDLQVSSAPGAGTRVCLRLPIAPRRIGAPAHERPDGPARTNAPQTRSAA